MSIFFSFIGYGWLIIELQNLYAESKWNDIGNFNPMVRIYIDSLGPDPVYSSPQLVVPNGWINFKDTYRSPRIPKTSKVTIEIMKQESIR